MPTAEIEARDVLFIRDGRRILNGASLSAPAASAALEGLSVSGKSTLLRVLTTLTECDSGQSLLGGMDARRIPPRVFRAKVAFVPQQSAMFEGAVAANLSMGSGDSRSFPAPPRCYWGGGNRTLKVPEPLVSPLPVVHL